VDKKPSIAFGLLEFIALGCSQVPNVLEIEHIKSRGGKVATNPKDKSVIKVWLNGTDADNDDLQIVARLPKLRELYLANSQVTDDGMKHLAGLSQLQILDLVDTVVGDTGVANLASLPW
jgi:hypothetical protein